MRLRVDRDALGEAVAFVSRVLPSRPVVPLLSGMLIEADEGGLTISCFDYEVSARCRVAAEVIEPGGGVISVKTATDKPLKPFHNSAPRISTSQPRPKAVAANASTVATALLRRRPE